MSGEWELNVTVLGSVDRVEMAMDGAPSVTMVRSSPGKFSSVIDTTRILDGEHTVTVEAFDGSNASDRVVIALVVDNTPPEMEVAWPDGDNFTRPFQVNVTFSDEHLNGSTAWVEAAEVEGVVFPLESRPWGFIGTVDISLLDNGTSSFSVMAFDAAGNQAAGDTRDLTVWVLPDLVVKRVYFLDSDPPQTDVGNYTVHFTVVNMGNAEAGPFDVVLFVEERYIGYYHHEGNLSVKGTVDGSIRWWAREVGTYNLTAVVDPDDNIEEINELNNERTTTRWVSERQPACFAAMSVVMVPLAACTIIVRRRTHRAESFVDTG